MAGKTQMVSVPAARSSAAMLAVRRRIVIALLAVAAAAGVLSAVAWLSRSEPVISIPPTPATSTVAFAQQVAQDYLNANPTAVPVADGIEPRLGRPDNSQKLLWSSLSLSGINRVTWGDPPNTVPVELVRFAVAVSTGLSGQQQIYNMYVPMASSTNGPYLAGLPSFLPAVLAPSEVLPEANLLLYANSIPGDEISASAKESITRWAQAFASEGKGSQELEILTGNQNPEVTYDGLGGWTLVDGPIFGSVTSAPNGQEGIVVQTTIVVAPPADTGSPVAMTYDVWVATGADQANPLIVAWGPAGSYPVMTPDMNQVPART